MAGAIRIGCSGWQYRHWRGLFYPDGLPQTRWFAHYAELFATVEINASFYRVPAAQTFSGLRDKAPPGFRYAVKANRFITHVKKLKDVAEPLAEFLTRARELGGALGPVLYQLPPRWRVDEARLAEFLALLPPDIEHALEFREPSWTSDRVLGMLDAAGVGFCVHDLHGSPRRREPRRDASPTSACMGPRESMWAFTARISSKAGATGASRRRRGDATFGFTSTTTSTATRPRTRRR